MTETSRMLLRVPDVDKLKQIRDTIKVGSDISFQFIEQGVHAPVITFWAELSPEQELLLDLLLTGYRYDDHP